MGTYGMTDMILIYITCDNGEEAKKIGIHLLKKRLCACFNIVNGMKAAYWWPPKSDKIEESTETIFLVKTLANKFDAIEKEVLTLHNSDTPCLIAIPTANVSKKYYEWIKGEIT